jgi:hypothetical protein
MKPFFELKYDQRKELLIAQVRATKEVSGAVRQVNVVAQGELAAFCFAQLREGQGQILQRDPAPHPEEKAQPGERPEHGAEQAGREMTEEGKQEGHQQSSARISAPERISTSIRTTSHGWGRAALGKRTASFSVMAMASAPQRPARLVTRSISAELKRW